jgi:hypothetical protein
VSYKEPLWLCSEIAAISNFAAPESVLSLTAAIMMLLLLPLPFALMLIQSKGLSPMLTYV